MPLFPTGDGVPGGNFVARFTIDSRPEIGSYVSQAINLDINGNFVWDPANAQIGNDTTNVDLSFTLPAFENGNAIAGNLSPHELLVAGKFRAVQRRKWQWDLWQWSRSSIFRPIGHVRQLQRRYSAG